MQRVDPNRDGKAKNDQKRRHNKCIGKREVHRAVERQVLQPVEKAPKAFAPRPQGSHFIHGKMPTIKINREARKPAQRLSQF